MPRDVSDRVVPDRVAPVSAGSATRAKDTTAGPAGAARPSAGRREFVRCFPASPEQVRQALRGAVARFARQIGPDAAGALELVLAETLNNIVEHAYGGREDGWISLAIVLGPAGLGCTLRDVGRPMPEGRIPLGTGPRLGCDVAALPEGGFGWSLIRQLVCAPAYRREAGVNELRFVLPLAG